MIQLLTGEAARWSSRRLPRVLALVFLVATAVLAALLFLLANPDSLASAQQAQTAYERAYNDWEDNHSAIEASCRSGSAEVDPEACGAPQPSPPPRDFHFSIDEKFSAVPGLGAAFLPLAGFILSASFAGGTSPNATTGQPKTFDSSRWRLRLAKLFVALLGSAGFTAAFLALGLVTVAAIEGVHTGSFPADWVPVLMQGGRVVALTLLAGATGFAIASLVGTGATIWLAVGFFLLSPFVWALAQAPEFAQLQPWLPLNNVSAYLYEDHTYQITTNVVTPSSIGQSSVQRIITFEHGVSYLLGWFGVAALASLVASPHRRHRGDP